MSKTAATTPREIAERRVAAYLRERNDVPGDATVPGQIAVDVVAIMFAVLGDPDQFMKEAGRRELDLALPHGSGVPYVRELAGATWRTMLAEAKR